MPVSQGELCFPHQKKCISDCEPAKHGVSTHSSRSRKSCSIAATTAPLRCASRSRLTTGAVVFDSSSLSFSDQSEPEFSKSSKEKIFTSSHKRKMKGNICFSPSDNTCFS